MPVNTKLSADSIVDPANNSIEFNYVEAFGGYALCLTAIVFVTAFGGCCRKRKNLTDNAAIPSNKEDSSNVAGDESRSSSKTTRPTVIAVQHVRHTSRLSSATQATSRVATAHYMMAVPRLPRGLINNGNTCYFNSAMQAVAHTSILEQQLGKIKDYGETIAELMQFYAAMRCSETSAYNPDKLQWMMYQRTRKFKMGMQHDSHECLLNILHELKKDEIRRPAMGQLTVVDKIFGGHCMTVYECTACGTPTHLCEPFLDISLPICSRPRQSRESSAESTRSRAQPGPSRPLPPLDSVNQAYPRQHEVNAPCKKNRQGPMCTYNYGDSGNTERGNTGEKRKNKSDHDSGKRNTEFKHQKREQIEGDSRFPAGGSTQQATSHESEHKRAYKNAVRLMMTTLSEGRAQPNLPRPSLYDSLQSYTRTEVIADEYLCRDCNLQSENENQLILTSATKRTLIFNPPAVLTLHLKRFENRRGEYVKRNTMVYYGETLDIGPYCSAWLTDQPSPSQNIWYSLYAVVVHSGHLEWGHYIAYVKVREFDRKILQFLQHNYLNRDDMTAESLIHTMKCLRSREERPNTECPVRDEGIWYCMNDHAVNRVSQQEVLDQKAFLLFYERL